LPHNAAGWESIAGILIAALGGLAVGLERERSARAKDKGHQFAGIRTFTLLGGLSGIAGWLWGLGFEALAMIVAGGATALVVAAYIAASREEIDATTEVAALVVIAAGLAAGLNHWRLSSAIIAITALLLVEKSRLHSFAARLSESGLRAGIRFAVMAVIMLPLLPEGPYGPLGGVRPRELWLLVLFFSGLSFAGYAARYAFGPSQGYVVAGLLGGLISSTNVALAYSRTSREEKLAAGSLALGVVVASTVLYLRVLTAATVLNRAMAWRLLAYLALPWAAGLIFTVAGLRRGRKEDPHDVPPDNPLQVVAALQMAVVFQMVLFGVFWMRDRWGEAGMFVSGAVLGLTDVDALTISMARAGLEAGQAGAAARATAIGILANTLMKFGISVLIGAPAFRRLAGIGLGVLAAASAIPLLWLSESARP
jgi:uncharacterized membrane protein (DUF4010 family)